ncbi:uncharacterized protein LOC124453105 isoform X1 [Xenia sp. Carnegie-2017]|uniref:uncharacterized protein LOC124453105 isoform X1 n=1 Tax=Xenia sp. Carnegie-2017 TaxID=2897299 RepID=UPI001F03A2F7|nr:uncharacterized protein LOC124453105 isoform X1 [Xenia sp. Carnegie-2017]
MEDKTLGPKRNDAKKRFSKEILTRTLQEGDKSMSRSRHSRQRLKASMGWQRWPKKSKYRKLKKLKDFTSRSSHDCESENDLEILDAFPKESHVLFNGLVLWLEMAERRLDLMETNIDDVDLTEDNEDTRVRKRNFQVFKEETRLQELKVTIIKKTCDTAIGLPGKDYRIAIRKWEVIKQRVTIQEKKLTLMSQDGDLSKIFCYLNRAEALLETCRNMSVNDGIV